MKKTIILAQLLLIIVFSACKSGKQGDMAGGKEGSLYGVKSGIVHYKPMMMMGVSMTQTLYFDDYGNKEVREVITEGNMMGQTMKNHSVDIREGLVNIHYELENMQNGQNMATKDAYKETMPADFLEQQNITELSEEMKAKMSYKEAGSETVAGLKGMKYTIAPDSTNPGLIATGVHYKNIPLKFAMGNIEMVADKVELDVKVPAEKFKVPEGFKIVERNMSDIPAETGSGEEQPGK